MPLISRSARVITVGESASPTQDMFYSSLRESGFGSRVMALAFDEQVIRTIDLANNPVTRLLDDPQVTVYAVRVAGYYRSKKVEQMQLSRIHSDIARHIPLVLY